MIQHGRKVTVKWPNGSTITGFIHPTEDGGANLVFGPKGEWGLQYIPPLDTDGFTQKPVEQFLDADMEYHEPPGLGAVVRAMVKGDIEVHLWTRLGDRWFRGENRFTEWGAFDQDTLEVLTDGFVGE